MHITMENSGSLTVSTVLLILLQPLSSLAVDIDGAKESPCFEIKKTVSMDETWAMSTKTWYYPMMSRLDLYLVGTDISGKSAEDLREDELYYDICLTFGEGAAGFAAEGFGGKKREYGVKSIKGNEIYEFYPVEKPEKSTKCYTLLTDNKSFAVAACCVGGEQMTWSVMSSVKSLPKDTVKMIHDHVESLGFKKEYFTGLRYDQCGKQRDKEKEEL